MKRLILFLSVLFIFSGIWQSSILANPCLSETYLHKMPQDTGAVAIDTVDYFNPTTGQTRNIVSIISHEKKSGKEMVFLNEYWGDDGSLRNSILIKSDASQMNFYGVDLNGKNVVNGSQSVTDYYIVANTSHTGSPTNFKRVALFRVQISSSGFPILFWEIQLGADFNNLYDNKAVSVERLPNDDAIVVANFIENGNNCIRPFATRVDPFGNVIWDQVYGNCQFMAHGSTIAQLKSYPLFPGVSPPNRLAITGQTTQNGSDVFIMLINENNGNEIWTKTYRRYGSQAQAERGMSITSYSEFQFSFPFPTVKNKLVVTGDIHDFILGPNPDDPIITENLFVMQVTANSGSLNWFKRYNILVNGGGRKAHGAVIHSVQDKKLVVGGRIINDFNGNDTQQRPFLMKINRNGNVDWLNTYLARDIITTHIDMIPSNGQYAGCEYYNMVVIGDKTPTFPFIFDFNSLKMRTDENGDINDPDCPPEQYNVSTVSGAYQSTKYIQQFANEVPENIPSLAQKYSFNHIDCGDSPFFGGGFPGGLREDNSEQVVTDHTWNLTVSPNPVDNVMNISFDLKDATQGSIEFYNVQGQLIDQISSLEMVEGQNKIDYHVGNYASGIYFCKVLTPEKAETIRFVKSN